MDRQPISHATATPTSLRVDWNDGAHFAFHPLWLRERSPGSGTLDPRTGQRIIEAAFLPLDLEIVSAAIRDGSGVEVEFSDQHTALYDETFLRRSIDKSYSEGSPGGKTLWNRKSCSPERFHLADITNSQSELSRLLDHLSRWGFVILDGAGTEFDGILKFTNLLGRIRHTNWGGVEDVRHSQNAFDLSLTNRALEPHVDNPYRHPAIGYVFLHCLENSSPGGESTLVDGFYAAEHLRTVAPASFQVLSSTPVHFRYEDSNAILENKRPLIELDGGGRLRSVAYSNRTEFVRAAPLQVLSAYYAARRDLANLIYSEDLRIEFKLESGQIVGFDNYRIFHGRNSFEAGAGCRHLRQAYIDKDVISSRREILLRDMRTGDA